MAKSTPQINKESFKEIFKFLPTTYNLFKKHYQKALDRNCWRYRLACRIAHFLTSHPIKNLHPWESFNCTAVIILINCDNKIVMGRRKYPLDHAGKFSLMAGYIDPAYKETIVEGAVREVYEECGIKLDKSILKPLYDAPPFIHYARETKHVKQSHALVQMLYGHINHKQELQLCDSCEMEEVGLYSIAEIQQMQESGDLAFNNDLDAITHAYRKLKTNHHTRW